MKSPFRCLLAGGALLLATGCGTPATRISSHQAAFDTWPAEVQAKVRTGHVDVGFTAEMVRVALGDADRMFLRTTEKGAMEVWVYDDHRPSFSFGLGLGTSHGSTAYGGGVTVGSDSFRDGEVMRVVFDGGRVAAIESRRK
jgi:hypothetical protein